MRTLLISVAGVAVAILGAGQGRAATAPPSRLGLCAACHGPTGHARMPGAPNLAGQSLEYLRSALAQYRDGRRDVPLMRTAIGPVSPAELDALTRWYSTQPMSAQATP